MMALALIICVTAATGGDTPLSGELNIFHAGSLSVPMAQLADEFTRAHPNVTIRRTAAGSRECARKVTDLNLPCDVLASADYAVIDSLLIPQHADWNVLFAGNEMAIVYTAKSRHAAEITPANWHDILLRDDVVFGRSDPNADPCGYRAVLTMKLAEKHYNIPGFTEKMLKKNTASIRPKETDLLALLETQSVDYLFLYRSVAQQHGLNWLPLPDEVNLKNAALAPLYAGVTIELTGTKPGEKITQKGEPMLYGVTIPKTAPNPAAATAFVAFLLDKNKGLAILEKAGQPVLTPCRSRQYDRLPEALKPFVAGP